MKYLFLFSILSIWLVQLHVNHTLPQKTIKLKKQYPKAMVNYDSFEALVNEVKPHREKRLVNLNEFVKLSQEDNVIILDTRSKQFYNTMHIAGAINLPFTEFTQQSLRQLIPDPNTKILIYCNNNIKDEPINFASKVVLPKIATDKPLTMALNIPTYINLYGYGYKNICELDELVSVSDSRIAFEGVYTQALKLRQPIKLPVKPN